MRVNPLRNSTRARGCEGKRHHRSRTYAEAHMARLIAAGGDEDSYNVYRCRHCSTGDRQIWRVGHRPGNTQSR